MEKFDINSDPFSESKKKAKSFSDKAKDIVQLAKTVETMTGMMGKPISLKQMVSILAVVGICAGTGAVVIVKSIVELLISLF